MWLVEIALLDWTVGFMLKLVAMPFKLSCVKGMVRKDFEDEI